MYTFLARLILILFFSIGSFEVMMAANSVCSGGYSDQTQASYNSLNADELDEELAAIDENFNAVVAMIHAGAAPCKFVGCLEQGVNFSSRCELGHSLLDLVMQKDLCLVLLLFVWCGASPFELKQELAFSDEMRHIIKIFNDYASSGVGPSSMRDALKHCFPIEAQAIAVMVNNYHLGVE